MPKHERKPESSIRKPDTSINGDVLLEPRKRHSYRLDKKTIILSNKNKREFKQAYGDTK